MTPPETTLDPEDLFAAVVDEFPERLNRGERPTIDEYAARHPHLAADLRDVLGMLSVLRPPGGTPSVGRGSTHPHAPREHHRPPAVAGFAVERELGRGGMGVVYLARQVKLNRPVALKMVLAGGHASAEERARFLAEAELIARLQHPHVVQVHEFGADADGRPFFALEYLPGGSLADRLRDGPLAPATAAGLIETVARAVGYAHGRAVIHRDLKPANVLFAADGSPKVTDFGLAKRADSGSDLTATGAVLGTPSYMPPEQAAGRVADLGPTADVYSLGAVLYECLTGRPPFRGASVFQTLDQVKNRDPIAVRELQPAVPRDLETIALKCLQKEPGRRYATAAELAADLRRFLDGKPIAARPVGAVERGWRWCRRNPVVAAAGLLVALAVGSAVVAVWYRETLKDVGAAEREAVAGRNAAVAGADRAAAAERGAQDMLGWSYRNRARATRVSGQPGQRLDALPTIAEGVALARRLGAPEDLIRPLRDEAVAALALPDLRLVRNDRVLPDRCALAVSPDHAHYATGTEAGVVTVCRLADHGVVGELTLPGVTVFGQLEFAPDGRSLLVCAVGGGDGEARCLARVWAWGGPPREWARTGRSQFHGAFSPDGRTVALAGPAGAGVELIDPTTGRTAGTVPFDRPAYRVVFSPDGGQLAVVGPDDIVPIRDIAGRRPPVLVREGRPVSDVAWFPDGRRVDGGTGRRLDRVGGPGGGNTLLSFAADARVLLTYARDGTGRLWDADGPALAMAVPSAAGRLSADGRRVVGRVGPRLQVWEFGPSPVVRRVTVGGGPQVLYPGGFSPDGRVLAVGVPGTAVELLDPATGRRLARVPGHLPRFLPGGGGLVTSGAEGCSGGPPWPPRTATGTARRSGSGPAPSAPTPPPTRSWAGCWSRAGAGPRRGTCPGRAARRRPGTPTRGRARRRPARTAGGWPSGRSPAAASRCSRPTPAGRSGRWCRRPGTRPRSSPRTAGRWWSGPTRRSPSGTSGRGSKPGGGTGSRGARPSGRSGTPPTGRWRRGWTAGSRSC